MPTFTCNVCQEALKGSAVDKHCVGRCAGAWVFTCVDCHVAFEGYDYKSHTQCITEAVKYHGKFAKTPKAQPKSQPSSPLKAQPEQPKQPAEEAAKTKAHPPPPTTTATTKKRRAIWEDPERTKEFVKEKILRRHKRLPWKAVQEKFLAEVGAPESEASEISAALLNNIADLVEVRRKRRRRTSC